MRDPVRQSRSALRRTVPEIHHAEADLGRRGTSSYKEDVALVSLGGEQFAGGVCEARVDQQAIQPIHNHVWVVGEEGTRGTEEVDGAVAAFGDFSRRQVNALDTECLGTSRQI
jgi:hypothetical protein